MNYDSADLANDYIFDVMWARSIGTAAETYMLRGHDQKPPLRPGGHNLLVRQSGLDKVSIAFNNMGDEAVKPLKISATLGHQGDPVFGEYEPNHRRFYHLTFIRSKSWRVLAKYRSRSP